MNILLINHYAGSPLHGMEYRPFYLAKYWGKAGHDVTIIASAFSHLKYKQTKLQNDSFKETINNVTYHWVKTPEYQGNGLGRLKNIWFFLKYLRKNTKVLSSNYSPDIVIASSTYPFDIFSARKIAKESNAKLVFEVHDLWPLSPIELGGYSKWHPFILLLQYAENYSYRNCDSVISMLPCAKQHMLAHGLLESKYNHIPNGIDLEEWENSKLDIPIKLKNKLEDLKKNNFFIVGYAGGHNLSNALKYFIQSKKYLTSSSIAFVLIGSGTEKQSLMEIANESKHIYFFEPIKKNAVPTFLSYIDIAYLGWNKSSLYQYGINPNKVFDYMAAGKAIIHSVDACNDPVDDAECGISCKAEEPKLIAQAIDTIATYNSETLSRLGTNAKKFVSENYDYKKLAQQFIYMVTTNDQKQA
jgi:glycosyltransferase involved in cell wall biosynthesis